MKTPKALILAAGIGKRFQPLTLTRPKPLLKILDKTVLEHNLDQLNGLVKEVILVIGYQGETIRKFFGNRYNGRNARYIEHPARYNGRNARYIEHPARYKNLQIKYVLQKLQRGTGEAARKALSLLGDRFLLLNGDDLYDKEDIRNCLNKFPSILLARAKDPLGFGVISCQGKIVKEIIEKPDRPFSSLVNTGLYFLPKSIFNFKIKLSPRGEYEFTDYLNKFIKKEKLFFAEAKNWYPLSCLWNLFEANKFLLKKEKEIRQGKIEKNVFLKGKIIVKKGALIKSGSYLEGPVYIGENSRIGPNCLIRGPASIGADCAIGQAVEVKNSIIGDNSKIPHLSYVGDSILGNNCNLGAGTIIANLRFDGATIKAAVNGKLMDTGRQKFGCVLGDNVKIGVNSSLMPGVSVGPNSVVGPNSIVFENIEKNTFFYTKFQKIIRKKKKIVPIDRAC